MPSVDYFTLGRKVAFTWDGHLALVPAAARQGDQVAVFFGGQVLYVVRSLSTNHPALKNDDDDVCDAHSSPYIQYQFIGECYVDEMMDGQALKLPQAQSVQCIQLV